MTRQTPSRPIEDVLAQHRDSLMSVPGVVGTAIGLCDGSPCIRVLFVDSAARAAQRMEPHLEGHTLRTEVSGQFRARGDSGG